MCIEGEIGREGWKDRGRGGDMFGRKKVCTEQSCIDEKTLGPQDEKVCCLC